MGCLTWNCRPTTLDARNHTPPAAPNHPLRRDLEPKPGGMRRWRLLHTMYKTTKAPNGSTSHNGIAGGTSFATVQRRASALPFVSLMSAYGAVKLI